MPLDDFSSSSTYIYATLLPESGPSPRYDAYETLLPTMRALDPKALLPINVDLVAATARVLARLPRLRALRPAIEAAMPTYDLAKFDSLERVALALQHAHALYLGASIPKTDLLALNAEGMKLRDRLRADAEALVAHEIIGARALDGLRLLVGYRNVGVDLMALVALFRGHATVITGKTFVDDVLLDRADDVADRLLLAAAVHERNGAKRKPADVTRTRRQAFTLFADVYDHVRRAVAYVRWNEGDADAIAPSIYGGRKRGKRAAESSAEEAAAASVLSLEARREARDPFPRQPRAPLGPSTNFAAFDAPRNT